MNVTINELDLEKSGVLTYCLSGWEYLRKDP